MSGNFWLDWAVMALSLTNTILLLWLGLTVLLNAEQRTWGAWVAGGGLLLGGVFFFSHSTILGFGLANAGQSLNFWWRLGWGPVIVLPIAWYVVMLWYAGFWDIPKTRFFQRQRGWLIVASILALGLIGLLFFANPLPSYEQISRLDLTATPSIRGVPLLMLLYPIYIVLCVGLSLDALKRPGPTGRVMGDIARRRARPWLVGTSLALLLVSLLVAAVMFWITQTATGSVRMFSDENFILAWFDLAISLVIIAAVVTLGQAVVAYEIFTGKALPRRGFLRQWRQAILLGFGYGAVISWSLAAGLRPIYSILLTLLLMTVFFALLSFRSYTERKRYIEHIRPFVTSQGLFDQLLTHGSASQAAIDVQAPFNALCKDVLDAKVAYLVAYGPLAPLVRGPLTYPAGLNPELGSLLHLHNQLDETGAICLPVEKEEFGGAAWAVPLWSERGQIGFLLLGEKKDGGLYTQEEIEIAQTSGERLIDNKASAEIAQRLMALQRQRLAESQLLDQRARRVLHDDVLQQLHTAMLKLVSEKSKPNGNTSEAVEMLAGAHSQISDLLREMPTTTLPEISHLGLVGALRKVLDEEMGVAFEEVQWNVDPKAEREAQAISPLTAEVIYYAAREAIRNAARHGRKEASDRPLHLKVSVKWKDGLALAIEDDGRGVLNESEENNGNGQGLALHSTMMAVVGGELAVESQQGKFTRVSLNLPQTP